MKRRILIAVTVAIGCLVLASCNGTNNVNTKGNEVAEGDTVESDATGYEVIEWENDPKIGKVQVGCYKCVGIVKDGETYEEMLELNDTENKGYLIVREDGTATFDLDGEKTEYVYDKFNFYPEEDKERTNGISYVYINGRIVVDDGTTVTQYLKLSEEELESYDCSG